MVTLVCSAGARNTLGPIGVNWEAENFFVTGDEGMNQETEDEGTNQQTFDYDPPAYEEAAQYPTVSTWV